MQYSVQTNVYDGPLHLFLELAKRDLIDLFLVKLVDLTHRYLQEVKTAKKDLNELAEPLPLLGNLMAIKARNLLPTAPTAEEEEVPVSLEELERRLQEYQQFKSVAQLLSELRTIQHKHFTRDRATLPKDEREPAEGAQPMEVEIGDLMSAFAKVLERSTAPVYEVAAEPWTVEQKCEELRVRLTLRHELRFSELFTVEQSTLELVCTFLALLELMRQFIARAVQDRTFGDIVIVPQTATPTEAGTPPQAGSPREVPETEGPRPPAESEPA